MNTITLSWLLLAADSIICFANGSWLSGNLCWSMPCLNGGSCFGSAYTYLCICPIHYGGASCEKRLGICQENPCGNRGVCIEKNLTTFECRCYFDYIGPTCQERIPRNVPGVWSTLLPTHTRVLFDMLEEAYRVRGQDRSLINADDNQIDFLGLLKSNETTSTIPSSVPKTPLELTSIANENDLTTSKNILHAHEVQHEQTSSGAPTSLSTLNIVSKDLLEQPLSSSNPTTVVSYSDIDMATTTTILENATTIDYETSSTNINEDEEFFSTIEESFTIIPSTSMESLDYKDMTEDFTTESPAEEITNEIESDLMTTTESIELTFAEIDTTVNEMDSTSDSPDQMTSLSPIETATSSPIAHRQLIYKLCRQLLSHILPNESTEAVATDTAAALSLASNSLPEHNKTADAFLSWLRKYVSTPKSTTTILSSSVPTVLLNGDRAVPIQLQRINIDDALQESNNET